MDGSVTAREPTILQEAQQLIYGARADTYGHPAENHGCTAAMVSAYLTRRYGHPIVLDAEDVCVFNVLQKISRQANEPARDNIVDAAGYLGNIERLKETS